MALLLPFLTSGCVGYVANLPEMKPAPELELTRAGLLHAMGPPSATRKDAAGETWIYRGEREEAGLLLVLGVVPLPLFVPVHKRSEVRFESDDDAAVSAEVRAVAGHARVCGFMGPCGLGPPSCSRDDD